MNPAGDNRCSKCGRWRPAMAPLPEPKPEIQFRDTDHWHMELKKWNPDLHDYSHPQHVTGDFDRLVNQDAPLSKTRDTLRSAALLRASGQFRESNVYLKAANQQSSLEYMKSDAGGSTRVPTTAATSPGIIPETGLTSPRSSSLPENPIDPAFDPRIHRPSEKPLVQLRRPTMTPVWEPSRHHLSKAENKPEDPGFLTSIAGAIVGPCVGPRGRDKFMYCFGAENTCTG